MNKTLLLRFGGPAAAVVMLTLGSYDLVQRYEIPTPTGVALSAGLSVPLLLHRRPYLAWWLALLGSLVTGAALVLISWHVPSEPWPWPVNSMAVLVLTTGFLAARGNRTHTVGAAALITIAGAWAAFAMPLPQDWISVIVCTVLCVFAAVLGDVVHSRSRVVDHLAEEKQVSSAERARIARELHDVVAHHMSMITVQAETARYRIAGLPEPVVTEFTGIAQLARSSLTELRGLLTALRDEQDAPALAPQPTLADLGELAARITAAGTPVRLSVTGAVAGLPEVLQLSAYRIVQEALSNVVRHAAGSPTTVDVAAAGALRIEVVNARPATPASPGDAGHGLVGLRERAVLLGGTFEVDQPGGGWRIRATLPIPAAVHGEAS
jgi:signal transduction histidine kinase